MSPAGIGIEETRARLHAARGRLILTFHDDDHKKGGRRRKADPKPDSSDMSEQGNAAERAPRRRLPSTDVGDALKSAYQRTMAEDIPPEMLDLLGKLG